MSSWSPGLKKKNRGWYPNEQDVLIILLNKFQEDYEKLNWLTRRISDEGSEDED